MHSTMRSLGGSASTTARVPGVYPHDSTAGHPRAHQDSDDEEYDSSDCVSMCADAEDDATDSNGRSCLELI